MTRLELRQAPAGARPPKVVLGEHNVEWDLNRQVAERERGLIRRLYGGMDWRKLRREEEQAWRDHDGVTVCSPNDLERLAAVAPAARAAVIPNAVDLEHYRPLPTHPAPDPRTIVFFGSQGYAPNADAILHFLDRIWPQVQARAPEPRLEIIGPGAPPEVQARRGPQVEVAGFVDDLRPRLARAAVVIAPLRMGGGTRLKILEAMAMGRPVVSTSLGAEGLEVEHGVELLLADTPETFAAAVGDLLADPERARRIGEAARARVEQQYSWRAASERFEAFARELLSPAEQARRAS
jgi:glycosyltransferase involved in cell wall biosynthesis